MSRLSGVSAPIRLRVPSVFRKKHLIGARPGTLMVSPSASTTQIRVIQYDVNEVTDRQLADVSELADIEVGSGVTWIDVQGLGNENILRSIAKQFGIHPLALEEMVNVPQRPKIAVYDGKLLWVTRMLSMHEGAIDREQLSLLHNHNLLISFQEKPGDILESVRQRIHEGQGMIRKAGADYLVYALVDTVVDGYFPIIEQVSHGMDHIEKLVMDKAVPQQLAAINEIKLLLTTLKRGLNAQNVALQQYVKKPTEHVSSEYMLYFKDVLDHTQHLSEVMDNQRELVAGLLNTYLSMVSYRANEVMKILTIMASIFIPLTFIAGVYGMNFQYMPELSYRWGYPVALGVMATTALGMVWYFVRKGWISIGAESGKNPEESSGVTSFTEKD